jgi:hypothetical protein
MLTKRFIIGFTIGLVIFILINFVGAHLSSDCGLLAIFGRDPCADDIARAGWPLLFYEQGGFDERLVFNVAALWLDIGLGLIGAGLFSWYFSHR